LINVDLPWNPSRLEQRIGRIEPFSQTRDHVDGANRLSLGWTKHKQAKKA
jgi:hypothetical protein